MQVVDSKANIILSKVENGSMILGWAKYQKC